jgi:beta-lactamase class A
MPSSHKRFRGRQTQPSHRGLKIALGTTVAAVIVWLAAPTVAGRISTFLSERALASAEAQNASMFATLTANLKQMADQSGGNVAISLRELGGTGPQTWSLNGNEVFGAASTYKLPLLMADAQQIASGKISGNDSICYEDADYQDGFYEDYADGDCFARDQLASRVGQESDNTAAVMLLNDLGGQDVLNEFARQYGATNSQLFDPNTTTADDLAAELVTEATGKAGGSAAQKWLYPLLTNTIYEAGIPAGVPSNATTVHKVGLAGTDTHDAALVEGSPNGDYVLVVMTDVPAANDWSFIASVSKAVWSFEVSRVSS